MVTMEKCSFSAGDLREPMLKVWPSRRVPVPGGCPGEEPHGLLQSPETGHQYRAGSRLER